MSCPAEYPSGTGVGGESGRVGATTNATAHNDTVRILQSPEQVERLLHAERRAAEAMNDLIRARAHMRAQDHITC